MKTSRFAGRVILAASVLLLAGCDSRDPYHRVDVWHPVGANALNLELQVAHPTDLVQGRGTELADGDTAAKAVDRLRHDKVKALPTATVGAVGTGSTSGGSSSGGSSSGGGT